MNVGSVHWVELPAADGHEQRGRRPAIVLQTSPLGDQLPVVLVVPLTSSRAALRFPGTVLLKPSTENGLHQSSVALVFQIRAIDRQRLQQQLGQRSETELDAIFAELDRHTGRA